VLYFDTRKKEKKPKNMSSKYSVWQTIGMTSGVKPYSDALLAQLLFKKKDKSQNGQNFLNMTAK